LTFFNQFSQRKSIDSLIFRYLSSSHFLYILIHYFIKYFNFLIFEFLLDFVWAIELNRFGLELIGLWPKINEVVKDKYYISDLRVIIIFIIITFISGIPLVCSLVRVHRNMLLVTDNLQITLPLIIVSLKLVIMRWKRSGLSKI